MIRVFQVFVVGLGFVSNPANLLGEGSVLPLPFRNPQTSRQSLAKDALLVPWIQSRTAPTCSLDRFTPDGQPASLWLYQGSLTDPVTGKVLAHVEGFEVVTLQGLWQNTTTTNSSTSRQPRKGQTKSSVATVLQNVTDFLERLPPNNPVTNWTQLILQRHGGSSDNKNQMEQTIRAAAVWESRKVFLYRSTDVGNDLLTTVRLRPAGPHRKVPLSQAIATWHAQTTVLQPEPANHNAVDQSAMDPTGQAFFFGTALKTSSSSPSTLVWNSAPVTWEETDPRGTLPEPENTNKKKKKNHGTRTPLGNLEFTIHARPRRGDQEAALQRHFAQINRPTGLAPPRSALVSLGSGSTSSSSLDATAAHETYRFSLPSGRLSYSRYGEGPVWYGPHRTCRMELRGQYTPDLQQLSPVIQELVRRLVTAPELSVNVLFPEEVRTRQASESVWAKHARWLQPHWQRLVQATTIQALPERSL